MKKIFFATLVAVSITFVSCTNNAIEKNTYIKNISNQHSEMLLNQKHCDSIGGQGGNTPPPPPQPFTS